MSSALFPILALALVFCAPMAQAQEPSGVLSTPWGNRLYISAFEAIESAHLAAAQRAISQLASIQSSRTIDNTLVPYDEALRQLNAAIELATLMQQAHPDASFRDRATPLAARANSVRAALSLNESAFKALSALDLSQANPATRYYVQRQLLLFHLSGIDKDESTRKHLFDLNSRISADESAYERNVADDPRIVAVIDPSDLDGLPQDFLDAHPPGSDGKIRIYANEPALPVVMKYAESANFRRSFWEAFYDRAFPKNREVLRDMLEARYEIARMLNYDSWVDLKAASSMIGSVRNIDIFLNGIDTGAHPVEDAEWAMLLAEKRKADPAASDIYGYEYPRLATLIRQSQFSLDELTMRQYFPYNLVQQGVLKTTAALFHLEFRQEKNASAWDPSVETWDVMDAGTLIGRFYLDMHPRPGKFTGNEMLPVVDGVRGKQLPEAALLCNFPESTATDPGLMEYEEVVAFFHQFAHVLHHIFSGNQPWAGISGIRAEDDFAEVPALVFEDWMRNPRVLASFARNYKTGEALASDQIARINHAFMFGRAIDGVAMPTAYAYIANDLHRHDPKGFDLDRMTLYDLRQYGRLMPLVAEGRMYSSFYALVYGSSEGYAHLWDKVIAEDFYQQFVRENLLEGDAAPRFRQQVLEPGGSMPPHDIVRSFLGRAQNLTAFQSWMGEEFKELPQKK